MTDNLNGWEKAGLITLGAGGVVNVLLYQLGYTLADTAANGYLFWLVRVPFAVLSFVGFDLTLVTTVMAMRAGRRSVWAGLTALLVLIAAGGMSLDVAAVVALPAWHAAPVVVLAVFALHLAAPRVAHRAETLARALGQRETELETARDEAETARDEAGRLRAQLEAAWAEAETERAARNQAECDAEDAVRRLRDALGQAELRARQIETAAADVGVSVAGRTLTLGQLAAVLEMPKSTLGRKIARAGITETGA